MPNFDTAGSARDLAEDPEPETGVIASALAAELYGLEILDEGIEDLPFNYTRFFVLGLDDPPRAQRSKTSLIFTTRHNPGALYDSLGEFAQRRINLTKIESRPRRNRPWQYLFYLDFEGHWQDPAVRGGADGLAASFFVCQIAGFLSCGNDAIYEDCRSDLDLRAMHTKRR